MCLISLDNMRGEKEHYMKEYHRLLDQLNSRTGQKNTVRDSSFFLSVLGALLI